MGAQAITGGLGLGLGLFDEIAGAKEKRNAAKAAANYVRSPLDNAYEGATVSQLGADVQREDLARNVSTSVDALAGGGARTLVGGLGQLNAGANRVEANIGAGLDAQQKEIDANYANDQARIRGMQENRENADLAALSSQYQSGKDQQQQGFGNIVQSAGMIGGGLMGAGRGYNPNAAVGGETTPTYTQAGYAPMSGYPTGTPSQFMQNGYGMFGNRTMLNTGY